MNKKVFMLLLLLFSSFCSIIPVVMAANPNIITVTIPNWDAGANCFCMKREYIFRAWVTDGDGATNISKVYVRGTDSGDATIFEVRADNLNSTPSWSIETGADVIDLNTSNCYWVEDGEYGYAYFYIKFEWDCPLYGNCGIFVYVEDSDGNSAGWRQIRDDFYDIIPKLVIEDLEVIDARDNIGDSNRFSGYLFYPISYDSNTSSMIPPPFSEFGLIHIHDSNHVSIANATIDHVVGYFLSTTFNIPNSVQLNTYHVYIDMIDDYTDGDSLDGDTTTIVGDRFVVSSFSSSDVSVPINTNVELRALVESEYDAHSLGTGDLLIIEGVNFTYDASDSRWEAIVTSATAQTYIYDVLTSVSEATYGITSGTMNGTSVTVTWYSSPQGSGGSGGGSSGVTPPPSGDGGLPPIISPSWWQRNGAFVIAALLIGSVFYGQMREPSEQEAKNDILSSITFNPNDVKDSLVDFGEKIKKDVWDR